MKNAQQKKKKTEEQRGTRRQVVPCPYCSPFTCTHSAEETRNTLFEDTHFSQDPDIAFTVFRGPGKIYRTMQGCVNGHAKVKRVVTKAEPSSAQIGSTVNAPAPMGSTNMGIGRMTSMSWRPKLEPTAAEIAEQKKLQRLGHLQLDSTVTAPELLSSFGVADTKSFRRFLDLRDDQMQMKASEFKQSGKLKEMQHLVKVISAQGNRAVYPKGPIERWNIHEAVEGAEDRDGAPKSSKLLAEELGMKKEGVEAIQNMNEARRREAERLEREEEVERERARQELAASAAAMDNYNPEEMESGSMERSASIDITGSIGEGSSVAPGEMLSTVMQLLPEMDVAAGEDGTAGEGEGTAEATPPPPEEIPGTMAFIMEDVNRENARRARYLAGNTTTLPQLYSYDAEQQQQQHQQQQQGETTAGTRNQQSSSVGGANSTMRSTIGPGGGDRSRPLSPEQTVGTAGSHVTKSVRSAKSAKSAKSTKSTKSPADKSSQGADEPQGSDSESSASNAADGKEESVRSLTPKELLMDKLSKCNLCRMQKVFCHRCKHDLSRYYKSLGGVPKPVLKYEATLRKGMKQNYGSVDLMEMLLEEFDEARGSTVLENPPPWDILKEDLHVLVVKMEALHKGQMDFLRASEQENREARADFKHRNFVVNVVEQHVQVHPDLKSIKWTKKVLDKVHPWDSTRSGVGLNSISSAYSARALDERLKSTKRDAAAAAQREGIELPGSGWHATTTAAAATTKDQGGEEEDGKKKGRSRNLTGKYAGRRVLPKVQPHLAKGRRPAGVPGALY